MSQSNFKKIDKSTKILIALLLAACILFGFVWYNSATEYKRIPVSSTDFAMSTMITQNIYAKDGKGAMNETIKRLQEFENTYSMYKEHSVISNINKNAGVKPVKVKKEEFLFLQECVALCKSSQGALDITIGPVVVLWGVNTDHPKVPDKAELKAALKLVDYKKIIFNENNQTVFLKEKGMAIDLGAIAKGESCRIIKEVYDEYHVYYGFASIGGNVLNYKGKGKSEGQKTEIRDATRGYSDTIGYLTIRDKVIATSGGYERFFKENGKEYHHIFDPKTGYPAESDLLSITVISDEGAVADGMSTILFVLGKDKLQNYLDDNRFDFVAVDKKGNTIVSNGAKAYFTQEKSP